MGSKERREREKLETRDRILDAARSLFVERGVEATTMREIAKRIDYTPTAIYHHFRDKDAVLIELCRQDFTSLAGAFVKIGRIDDPLERLRRIGLAYAEFGMRNPSHYRFMFMTPNRPVDPDKPGYDNPQEDAYAFLKQAVRQAIAEGRLRPEYQDADLVAQLLWGAVHGIVSLHIAMHNQDWVNWCDHAQTVNALVEALMRGIAVA